jgi:uncharacterized protein YodC (DUF2158 family)
MKRRHPSVQSAQALIDRCDTMQIRLRTTPRAGTASFSPGDVLTLRSGGQSMTATWVGPVAFAPGIWLICQWFDREGELRQEMFPESSLGLAIDTLAA